MRRLDPHVGAPLATALILLIIYGVTLAPGLVGGVPSWTNRIYARVLLLRTWLLLQKTPAIRLPEDVERSIEDVYGDTPITSSEDVLRDALRSAEEELAHQRTRHRDDAHRVRIASPGGLCDILECYNLQLDEEEDPVTHRTLRAATRAQDVPTVRILCLHRIGGVSHGHLSGRW